MKTKKNWIVTSAIMMLICSFPAWAQDAPTAELFGGFSWRSDGDFTPRYKPVGWQAGVSYNLGSSFGIAGDVAGQYKSGTYSYQFLAGPRFTARGEKINGFGHIMLGILRDNNGSPANQFALGVGGGVDIKASDRVSVRAVQFDWIPNRLDGSWFKDNIRLAVGLVFPLGK